MSDYTAYEKSVLNDIDILLKEKEKLLYKFNSNLNVEYSGYELLRKRYNEQISELERKISELRGLLK